MKAGVAIAGSLWWDQTEPCPEWRSGLNVDGALQATLPIRYGRRFGTKATVFSTIYSAASIDGAGAATGHGRIVPFARPEVSATEVLEEADTMAEAEGLLGAPWPEWGAVIAWFRPDWDAPEREQLRKAWPDFLGNRLPAGSWLMRPNPDAPEPPLLALPNADLALPWPRIVDTDAPAPFDVLLAAVNKPTYLGDHQPPNTGDIARSFVEAGDPSYFIRNVEAGIRTQQDAAIWLRVLELRPDWSRRYPKVIDFLQRAS